MTGIILGAVILVSIVIWAISTSNGLKRAEIKIEEADSGIDVALTKRYDMLTKMLDITKAYAKHETETISTVIALRKGMTIGERSNVNAELNTLNDRINVVAEAYPELRSSDTFVQLQKSAGDAEEHLQAARRLYNSTVSSFNQKIVMFPTSIIANSMKLSKHEFFDAEEGKKTDVKMDF